jgi:hypothetical protein
MAALWIRVPIIEYPDRRDMDRLPNAMDLTQAERASLALVCRGFMCATIPKPHQVRLVELGLIQAIFGGLMITPMGRMVARA